MFTSRPYRRVQPPGFRSNTRVPGLISVNTRSDSRGWSMRTPTSALTLCWRDSHGWSSGYGIVQYRSFPAERKSNTCAPVGENPNVAIAFTVNGPALGLKNADKITAWIQRRTLKRVSVIVLPAE